MRRRVFLVILVLLAGGAAPALAQREQGSPQPLDRIIEGIRNSRSGSFYDAQGPFQGPDGRPHYRIKWMTPEGRVIWLDTDAQSGRVLGTDSGGRRPGWDEEGGRRPPRAAPDRERFERGPDSFGPGGFGPGDDGRGDDRRGRYDGGDFGGRILPGGGRGHSGRHDGPNE